MKWILDIARTIVNVLGNCTCTLVVSNIEKELDIEKEKAMN